MSSATKKTPAQLAAIDNLSARLAKAKSNRSTQIEAINQLKMRRINEYTNLLKFRDDIDQRDREAQSPGRIADREDMPIMESQTAGAMREWRELGSQLQREFEELRLLEKDISGYERISAARKALQEG